MSAPKIILLTGLALLVVACQKSPQLTPEPRQKVTVAFTTQPEGTLVHVALARGFLQAEGLDITPVTRTYGKAALQEVLDNKADIATVAETPIVMNVLKGEAIRVFATIVASDTNNGVIARRDMGINGPSDLKGKRIGFTPGTTSDFFLSSLLTANGLRRSDIQGVSLKPEEMLDAIMTRKVDAVSAWNYPLTQIRHALGENGLIIFDREVYTEMYALASQKAFVEQNPRVVERFLRAMFRAEQFVQDHPDEAQSIMAQATGVALPIVAEVWNSFRFHVGLSQELLITLEDETRWAMDARLTPVTVMPNYLDYLYFDGLQSVRPQAIHMKH